MQKNGRLSIMQPYVFPYIGYFHLIEASDMIVFYDDVHFKKPGWINRNRILLNGRDFMFTIPVRKASQNKLINEIVPIIDQKFKKKFYHQIESAYKKAPYYKDVSEIIYRVLEKEYSYIDDLVIHSIEEVYNYLGKSLHYTKSSVCSPGSRGINKSDRLIKINKDLHYSKYVNPIGAIDLYSKDYFQQQSIQLFFVKSNPIKYSQFSNEFIPSLSVIDILMFNDKDEVKKMFKAFELV